MGLGDGFKDPARLAAKCGVAGGRWRQRKPVSERGQIRVFLTGICDERLNPPVSPFAKNPWPIAVPVVGYETQINGSDSAA